MGFLREIIGHEWIAESPRHGVKQKSKFRREKVTMVTEYLHVTLDCGHKMRADFINPKSKRIQCLACKCGEDVWSAEI